jgi:NADH-quinone oxidoreductase subunit N
VSSLALQPGVLGPLVWVVLGALVIVLGERALARRESFLGRPITAGYAATLLGLVAIASLVIAAYIAATHAATGAARSFQPALPRLRLDSYSSLVFAGIAGAAALTCAVSLGHLPVRRAHRGDYYALVLFATAGAFLLVSALDLVVLFLGVELLGLCLVALVGFDVRDARGQEAAVKLGLVGAVSSAVLLYGMALLFAAGGGTDYASVRESVAAGSGLAKAGVGLVLAGFATRLATVPFHAWAADVTEGAPRPVAAFVWTVAFSAAVAALLRFSTLALAEPGARVLEVMRVLAGLSIFVGACMAWIQQSPRRLLAYVGVAHAGFLWIGFLVATERASVAILFQLAAQGAAFLGALTVLVAWSHRGLSDRIDSLAGVARAEPGLAALLSLYLFSLAGFPGTAGFVGRMGLLLAALREGEAAVALGALAASAVVVAALIRVPRELYLRAPSGALRPGSLASGEVLVLTVCTLVVVVLGVAPAGGLPGFEASVLDWMRNAVALGLNG